MEEDIILKEQTEQESTFEEVQTNEEQTESLSARRAWIEILYSIVGDKVKWVALRKESVDRNDD